MSRLSHEKDHLQGLLIWFCQLFITFFSTSLSRVLNSSTKISAKRIHGDNFIITLYMCEIWGYINPHMCLSLSTMLCDVEVMQNSYDTASDKLIFFFSSIHEKSLTSLVSRVFLTWGEDFMCWFKIPWRNGSTFNYYTCLFFEW